MNVSIIREEEEKSVLPSKKTPLFIVEQVNDKPLAKQSSFGRIIGNKVAAFVPACSPTAASLVPEKDFKALACCYENTIMAAIAAGARTVAVRQLGVGRKVNATIGTGDSADIDVIGETSRERYKLVEAKGKVVGCEVWGDMFWTVARTSLAARLAIQAADHKTKADVEVVFIVPADAYGEWDATMAF